MKAKFMKKMISVLCASVMTTSCAVGSVGAIQVSYADLNTDREYRVLELDENIQQTIQNMGKVIDRLQQVDGEDAREAIKALESIKESLMDTEKIKLCHDDIIERVERQWKVINNVIDYMMKSENDDLVYDVLNRSNDLEASVAYITKGLLFSNDLDNKRSELRKASVFIKKMKDSEEKLRLQKIYNEAQNYYDIIVSTVTFVTKPGKAQAQKFFEVADKAISELNEACNAQKAKEGPAPIAGKIK